MLASQRTRLIERGLTIGRDLHPGTITFAGHDPIPVVRRTGAASADLGDGSFEGSAPQTFFVLTAALAGITITAKKTTFTCDGATWRIMAPPETDPGEPHTRLVANIPTANARG